MQIMERKSIFAGIIEAVHTLLISTVSDHFPKLALSGAVMRPIKEKLTL